MDPIKTAERLRKLALRYPETYEESPWGDRVVKVKGKIFLFCGAHEGNLILSLKLPKSGREALREPWARPTPYGLGKSGWVSATFDKKMRVPEERLEAWIDESYRALAPKTLLKRLDEAAPDKTPAPRRAKLPHSVVLVCEDELRARRAERALAAQGIALTVETTGAAVRKKLTRLDAVILDLGRSQDDGLQLAGAIDASDHPIHLFIVGIRDARAHKRAGEVATSAELFRAPPGDSEVAAAVGRTLAQHPRRKR